MREELTLPPPLRQHLFTERRRTRGILRPRRWGRRYRRAKERPEVIRGSHIYLWRLENFILPQLVNRIDANTS